jgi:hypothetical protein
MFFAILVILKGNNVELPKARGQLGDRGNLNADMIRAVAVAGVSAAFIKQFLDMHML